MPRLTIMHFREKKIFDNIQHIFDIKARSQGKVNIKIFDYFIDLK